MQTNNAPAYNVKIDGKTFTQQNPQGLELLRIEDNLEMIGRAEFTFKSAGGTNAPWSSFKVGGAVEVKVGGGSRKMFVGKITEVNHGNASGSNNVTVVAMDPLHEAAATRKTRTWEDKKDSDIISEVLGSYTPGTVDPTDYVNPYVFQRNESDFAFMRRLAARNGYSLYANEGKIDFTKPQQSSGGLAVGREEVINFDYNQGSKKIPGSVRVVGWDYDTKEKVEGTATGGDIPKIGSGQICVGQGGGPWGSEEKVISEMQVSDQNAAKQMAIAELFRSSCEFLRGSMTVQGNSALHVGATVMVKDQQQGFNPEVLITSARHEVSNKTGLLSEITFCSNTIPK